MATGKFIVPEHDHYLSTIRSCAEAQKVLKNYKYANFDGIRSCFIGGNYEENLISYLNSIFKSDNTENPDYTVDLQFSSFNNLYEEYCTLWSVMMLERYERIKDVKKIRTTPATNDNLGMVKLSADSTESGLLLDSSGSILVNYGQVQSKLESGKNIKHLVDNNHIENPVSFLIPDEDASESDKSNLIHLVTLNGKSLIVDNPNDKDSVKNFEFVKPDELMALETKVLGGSELSVQSLNESFTKIVSTVNNNYEELTAFRDTLVNLQNQVINLISDMQSGIGGQSSSGGQVGPLICTMSTPKVNTCDDIQVNRRDSYYIKVVDGAGFRECSVSGSQTEADPNEFTTIVNPWFSIDADALTPLSESDFSTIRFTLEIRVEIDDPELHEKSNWKFPWMWSDKGSCRYDIVPDGAFEQHTVNLIEITGIWKCGMWNWYGKMIDTYNINCENDDIQ